MTTVLIMTRSHGSVRVL